MVSNNLRVATEKAKHCMVTFFAYNPSCGMGADKYAKKYLKWFSEIGINFESYRVIDNRMIKNEMKENIRNASVVFLMGGVTPIQFKFIKENELDKDLCEYKRCILGLSAGAINMAKISICSKSFGHDETEIYEGLNLVYIKVKGSFYTS